MSKIRNCLLDWFVFVLTNFILSFLPTGLLFFSQHLTGSSFLNHENIPEFLMITFAVCLNVFNMFLSKRNGNYISIIILFILLVICASAYNHIHGAIAEISDQLNEFLISYNDHPEFLPNFEKTFNDFLQNRLNEFRWEEMISTSIIILFICFAFGTITVIKDVLDESMRLSEELYAGLKNAKKKLSDADYKNLIHEVGLNTQRLNSEIENKRLEIMKNDFPRSN